MTSNHSSAGSHPFHRPRAVFVSAVLGLALLPGLLVLPVLPAAAEETQPAADCAQQLEAERIRIQDLQVKVIRLEARLREALQWKLVRELEAEVSEIRGLPVKRHIVMETLDRDATRRLIQRLLDADMPPPVARSIERTLVLLGALPPGTDLRQTLLDLFSEQVGGLYDDREAKLYVSGLFDPDSSIGRIVLAHEICHALQDQNFDLSRYPIHRADNDDLAYAAASVLEGDATVLMANYMVKNVSLSWLVDLPKMMSLDQEKLNAAPPYLQYLLLFPYLEGMNLILAAESISPDARARLLRMPPLSTEQVIHPEKYFGDTQDRPVPASVADLSGVLGPGWAIRAENTYGEQGVRAILMRNQPIRLRFFSTKPIQIDPEIVKAAEGWGGDRVALWVREPGAGEGDRGSKASGERAARADEAGSAEWIATAPAVVQWRSAWDTEQDAYEFRRYAATTWLPSLLPGAKEAAETVSPNSLAWTGDNQMWARLDWDGKQVDVLIGQGEETRKLLSSTLPQ